MTQAWPNIGPIRFDSAQIHRVSIPLVEPFRSSSDSIDHKDAVIVWLQHRKLAGWVESSAMSGGFYSAETPEQCEQEQLETIVPKTLGCSFPTITDLDSHLSTLTPNRMVSLKLQRVESITEALRLIGTFRLLNTPMWMGTMPELSIGSARALTLASDPIFTFPSDVEPSNRWYVNAVVSPGITLDESGNISPPDGIGWRYLRDKDRLQQHCLKEYSL